jgi:hypothetical protein
MSKVFSPCETLTYQRYSTKLPRTSIQEKSLAFIPPIDKHSIHFVKETRNSEFPKEGENFSPRVRNSQVMMCENEK